MRRILFSVFILLLVAGVFLGCQFFRRNQPTRSLDTTAPLVTEEWKTCRNDEAGYQLDYPANWFISAEDGHDLAACSGSYVVLASLPGKILNSKISENFDDPNAMAQVSFFSIEVDHLLEGDIDPLSLVVPEDNPDSFLPIGGETFRVQRSTFGQLSFLEAKGRYEGRSYIITTNVSDSLLRAILSDFSFI